MKFDPKIHHRHSIRLKGYDYSQSGAYFVTLVTWQRECLFGEIVDGEMVLHRYGQIVRDAWFDLRNHYRHLDLGAFVVMPNHAHGIIALINDREPLRNGRGGSPMSGGTNLHDGRGGSFIPGETTLPVETSMGKTSLPKGETRPYGTVKRHGLPEIVRAFKSFSARRINRLRHMEGIPVWQRNYYEHIIRNESEMDRITRYIESNPSRWADDDENPM